MNWLSRIITHKPPVRVINDNNYKISSNNNNNIINDNIIMVIINDKTLDKTIVMHNCFSNSDQRVISSPNLSC